MSALITDKDDCKRDPNDGFDITLVGNISNQLFESEVNKLIISNHTDNSSQWNFHRRRESELQFLDHTGSFHSLAQKLEILISAIAKYKSEKEMVKNCLQCKLKSKTRSC